uniref:Uncharacterized protein n=1 Tax=Rhipicephalus zambeziensis TaxID=60191 RepID=A0A224Y6V3_9ACAR
MLLTRPHTTRPSLNPHRLICALPQSPAGHSAVIWKTLKTLLELMLRNFVGDCCISTALAWSSSRAATPPHPAMCSNGYPSVCHTRAVFISSTSQHPSVDHSDTGPPSHPRTPNSASVYWRGYTHGGCFFGVLDCVQAPQDTQRALGGTLIGDALLLFLKVHRHSRTPNSALGYWRWSNRRRCFVSVLDVGVLMCRGQLFLIIKYFQAPCLCS